MIYSQWQKLFPKKVLPPLEECTIAFLREDEVKWSWQERAKRAVFFPVRVWKILRNTYLLIRHQELREPAHRNVCPMRYLNPFSSLVSSNQIVSNPRMMKAMLKYPRTDREKGLFEDQDNANAFLPLLRDLFPEEPIEEDDFLLSCSRELVGSYRQPFLRFIGPQNLKKHADALEEIFQEAVEQWIEESEQGRINATKLALIPPTAVISKLLLADPGPYDVYKKIAEANDYMNKYIIKRLFKQPPTPVEKSNYQSALVVMKEAIEKAYSSKEIPLFGSFVEMLKNEKGMTPIQIKAQLFLAYFAGSETTASLIGYLLWQLGQKREWQEKIFEEFSQKEGSLFEVATTLKSLDLCYYEAIRLFTPSYAMGRRPVTNVVCIVKDRGGKEVFRESVGKKTSFLGMPTFAARDPSLFKEAHLFNPERHTGAENGMSWFPFGDGVHSCPGQWLAEAEVKLFTLLLLQRCSIDSFPKGELKQKGLLTLKSAEDIYLTLTPRN